MGQSEPFINRQQGALKDYPASRNECVISCPKCAAVQNYPIFRTIFRIAELGSEEYLRGTERTKPWITEDGLLKYGLPYVRSGVQTIVHVYTKVALPIPPVQHCQEVVVIVKSL